MEPGGGRTGDGPVPGPAVDPVSGEVTFVVDADVAEAAQVQPRRVWYHLRAFGDVPTFRPDSGWWLARIPTPPVDRLEYLLVLADRDGHEAMVLDPANDARVDGVFGAHSVLELPGYRPPAWTSWHSQPWSGEPVTVTGDDAGIGIQGEVLTPPGLGPTDPLPLLVVHDGPEYVRLARLLDYLDWAHHHQGRAAYRVLCLQPADRDRSYAANPTYTDTLVGQTLPRVRDLVATVGLPVGLGASLGALALAYAAAEHPGAFAGLMWQSGSFFVPRFDAHERQWPYYGDVVTATAGLYAEPARLAGIPIRLTAGLGEENLDNNRALAHRLDRAGLDALMVEGRDGHNYTAWRDLLDPTLGDLLDLCAATVSRRTGRTPAAEPPHSAHAP